MGYAPLTENLSVTLARKITAMLSGSASTFRLHGKVEDLGGQSCRLEVRHGCRRTPGAGYGEVDTERHLVVSITEIPKEQQQP
jgi:hypothetical protein